MFRSGFPDGETGSIDILVWKACMTILDRLMYKVRQLTLPRVGFKVFFAIFDNTLYCDHDILLRL